MSELVIYGGLRRPLRQQSCRSLPLNGPSGLVTNGYL
jgi:hypothetical protein